MRTPLLAEEKTRKSMPIITTV